MIHFDEIHQRIIEKQDALTQWHLSVRKELPIPAYTSVDIRDSGAKIASVDANIYPAGFNNICDVDREAAPQAVAAYLKQLYGDLKKVALVTEEHTTNAYYWQNVFALKTMIETAGYEIHLAFPQKMDSFKVESANGNVLDVHGSWGNSKGDLELSNGFVPEIILSNNDFSQSLEEWAGSFTEQINPPREVGWHKRKKSEHFKYYNEYAGQFAEILDLPKEYFQIKTELFSGFDMTDENSKQALATKVDQFIGELEEQYTAMGINYKPMVFVKNNAGTYGLAVKEAKSGEDVLSWNNRARTKMKAAKGGNKVEEVIIQEGIPSRIKSEESVAEPVVYLFGCKLIGGFLRTHNKKGESESLNSPGAVYKRMCMNDLLIHKEDHPQENVYGWVGKLSSLAIGKEIKEVGATLSTKLCV